MSKEKALELLTKSAEAAIAYDRAIQGCADDPDKMNSFCTAQGDDLDSLYFNWLEAARAGLKAVKKSASIANKANEIDLNDLLRLSMNADGVANSTMYAGEDFVAVSDLKRFMSEQAAANKAAEEGGLPAQTILKIAEQTGLSFVTDERRPDDSTIIEFAREVIFADGAFAPSVQGELPVLSWAYRESLYETPDFSQIERMEAEIADWRKFYRASRQVANKAEVDLSRLSIAWYMKEVHPGWPEFNRIDEFSGGLTDGDKLVRLADVEALLATPPATNGASAALRPTDDELWDATLRDRDAYHDWADKLADAIANYFGVDIGEHSNQNLPWDEALQAIENAEPVGASTGRDQVLEEAAEAIDAMNDASGDAAAYDNRDQNLYELEREHAISACAEKVRALKGSVGASTVLTDERIEALFKAKGGKWVDGDEEGFWKIEDADLHPFVREVAAQAGQVAVPEESLRVVRRLLDGTQPKDLAGAIMVIDSALNGGAAWAYDIDPPPGFLEYVQANYSGDVTFHDPAWHARRLWNAAMRNFSKSSSGSPQASTPGERQEGGAA